MNVAPPLVLCTLLLLVWAGHAAVAPLWLDEVYTYFPVTDPSFGHMVRACADSMNTMSPLPFLSGWLWVRLFGPSEAGLRLLSCLFTCAAAAVMWALVRPRYGRAPAAGALAVTLLTPVVLGQARQARFYGLYLLLVALTTSDFARRAAADGRGKGRGAAPRTALLHAGMIFAHPFGLLYSATFLATWLVHDLWRRRRPDTGYVTAVLIGWACFALLWGPQSAAQARSQEGFSWVPLPGRGTVAGVLLPTRAAALGVALAALGGGAALLSARRRRQGGGVPAPAPPAGDDPLPLLGVLLYLGPVVVAFLVSRAGIASCFLDRYLMPSGLGLALCVAAGVRALADAVADGRRRPAAAGLGALLAGAAIWCASPVFSGSLNVLRTAPLPAALLAPRASTKPWEEVTRLLERANIPPGVPVVCTDVYLFGPALHYSPQPSPLLYVLDREHALRSARPGHFMVCIANVSALGRQYAPGNVTTAEDLLATAGTFAVIESDAGWAEFRIVRGSGFEKELRYAPAAAAEGRHRVFLVRRVAPPPR